MKKPIYSAVVAYVLSALDLKELPTGDDGKLALNAAQDAELKKEFPGDQYESVMKNVNSHLALVAAAKKEDDATKVAEKQNVLDILAGKTTGDPVTEESPTDSPSESPKNSSEDLRKLVAEQQATIEKLKGEPENELSVKSIMNKALVGTALALSLSSATHLFGSMPEASAKLFSFEGRNWNAKAAGLKTAGKTDFTDVSTITRLNEDLKEYQVQNPGFIRDLYIEKYGLPEFWEKRFGVVDQIQDAVMDISNVTQARKPDWIPGFEIFLAAEKRRIYRIQIDMEFTGYQLQELETSWLASIYKMDGSSPYKYTFVAFLLKKISDKARLEDREGAIKGIFVPTPAGIKTKGHYLNAQSGVLHQLFSFVNIKKTVAQYISPLGKFINANAYEYVKGMVESLPLAVRNATGRRIYMSPSNIVKVKDNYKFINSQNNDYSGNDINYIDGYPNLPFYGMVDLEGTDLIFITADDNVEILEYLPEEKEKYRFEYLKRDTFFHADYRFGCAFVFSGFELPNAEFKGLAQFIWVNDAPIFNDTVSIPLFGSVMSSPIEINYNKIHVHPELISDVVKLTGMPAGTVVKIVGNQQMSTSSVIKKKTGGNGGNLDLTTDFNPKTTYSITMVVQADGNYKEVARNSDFPGIVSAVKTFNDLALDLSDGPRQKYEGTSPGTLEDIVGGNEGAELTIYGSENALTVSATEKIVVQSNAVLDSDTKFIKLRKFEGVWFETSRG
ncbi:hypothetical protein [Chryseobacterium vrystaatense]|uniref:Uncharacterized protein n=1 Tax=Chryseobacterium vrystaatense TaxID=307480 RepID=A0ABR4UPI6_9FLAO|nr:hypothetical protein [Chryseobacterium vrystaatense]KFF26869.1 hypothetical protein IW16_06210 [Chryseobacterium vrystaatense]